MCREVIVIQAMILSINLVIKVLVRGVLLVILAVYPNPPPTPFKGGGGWIKLEFNVIIAWA